MAEYEFTRGSKVYPYSHPSNDPAEAERDFDLDLQQMQQPIAAAPMEAPSLSGEIQEGTGILKKVLPFLVGGGATNVGSRLGTAAISKLYPAAGFGMRKAASMAGEAVGSGAAEAGMNVAEGQPIDEGVGWAAAFPVLGRVLGYGGRKVGQAIGEHWPGSAFASQRLAAGKMRALPHAIDAPTTGEAGAAIEDFLSRSRQQGLQSIPTPLTGTEAGKIQNELNPLIGYLRSQGDEKAANTIQMLVGGGRSIPVDEYQAILRRTGQLSWDAPQTAVNAAKRLRQKLKEDLDVAAVGGLEQAQGLQGVRQTYRRAKTKEEIGEVASKRGVTIPASDSRVELTAPGTVERMLTQGVGPKGAELTQRFQELLPEERQSIIKTLREISAAPRPQGTGGRFMGHPFAWAAGLGAAGGLGLGAATGGGPGAMYGGPLGLAMGAGSAALINKLREGAKSPQMQAFLISLMENQLGQRGSATAGGAFGQLFQRED